LAILSNFLQTGCRATQTENLIHLHLFTTISLPQTLLSIPKTILQLRAVSSSFRTSMTPFEQAHQPLRWYRLSCHNFNHCHSMNSRYQTPWNCRNIMTFLFCHLTLWSIAKLLQTCSIFQFHNRNCSPSLSHHWGPLLRLSIGYFSKKIHRGLPSLCQTFLCLQVLLRLAPMSKSFSVSPTTLLVKRTTIQLLTVHLQ